MGHRHHENKLNIPKYHLTSELNGVEHMDGLNVTKWHLQLVLDQYLKQAD